MDMRSALGESHGAVMQMRFGLHPADVSESGEDPIGDGVNVAARSEQTAEPSANAAPQSSRYS